MWPRPSTRSMRPRSGRDDDADHPRCLSQAEFQGHGCGAFRPMCWRWPSRPAPSRSRPISRRHDQRPQPSGRLQRRCRNHPRSPAAGGAGPHGIGAERRLRFICFRPGAGRAAAPPDQNRADQLEVHRGQFGIAEGDRWSPPSTARAWRTACWFRWSNGHGKERRKNDRTARGQPDLHRRRPGGAGHGP